MTRERAKELLSVIQAWAEGKTIQIAPKGQNVWDDLILDSPNFDDRCQYRIKPEPREFYLRVHGSNSIGEGFPLSSPYAQEEHEKYPQSMIKVREVPS